MLHWFIATALSAPFDSQGHRGARGLLPENSLPSFERALEHGMRTLELDTVLTKDGRLLVHHDTSTNAKLCVDSQGQVVESRPIRQQNLKQLRLLECGMLPQAAFPEQQQLEGIHPSALDELLRQTEALAQANAPHYNIELKFPRGVSAPDVSEAVDRILLVLQQAGLQERSTVQSFHHPALELVKQRAPGQAITALFSTTRRQYLQQHLGMRGYQRSIIAKTVALNAAVISPHYTLVDQRFVDEAHAAGLRVVPWTVNDSEQMQFLISLGIDGLISDYPDRLSAVLKMTSISEPQR